MNTPVSFEIAKLLKEKRFDRECNSLFIHEIRNGDTEWKLIELFERNNKDTYDFLLSCDMDWQKHYLRPTIAEVVMWLYEKHGIWIEVRKSYTDGFVAIIKSPRIELDKCSSPTEAYEAAIEHALKYLI